MTDEFETKQLMLASSYEVLIVEDDPVSAKIIGHEISKLGYKADFACNGVEALGLHRVKRHRIVISDWMMPEMDGLELCEAVRASNEPYVYYITITAKESRKDRLRAFEAGVDDFISKPLQPDDLRATLQVASRILAAEDKLQIQNWELENTSRSLSDLATGLSLASRRFETLFSGLPVPCFTVDRFSAIREWNQLSTDVFGVEGHYATENLVSEILKAQDDFTWSPLFFSKASAKLGEYEFKWTFLHESGKEVFLFSRLINLFDEAGHPNGAIIASVDVTESVQAARKIDDYAVQLESQQLALQTLNVRLEKLATTDGLTGLANRRRFQEFLQDRYDLHERDGRPFALLMIDIDFFKQLNDNFGHQVGDQVLQQFAKALNHHARKAETPARYGGEEFAFIINNCDKEQAVKAAERFRAAIEAEVWTHRPVTCSIGVSNFTAGSSVEKLIRDADAALYESKRRGRNQVTHANEVKEQAA